MYRPTLEDLTAADRDAQLMTELANPALGRATLAPITLATVGLDAQEFKRIVLERAAEQDARRSGIIVEEGGEHYTLAGRFSHVQRSGSGKPGSIEEC